MSTLVPLLSLGEAIALVVLFAALLHLRGRIRDLSTGSTGTLTQMHELVQEAQSLSTLLASQLSAQVTMTEQTNVVARKPLAVAERPAGVPVAAVAARTSPAVPTRRLLPDAADLDQVAARERGMDPLGLALQRSLHRGVQPAS